MEQLIQQHCKDLNQLCRRYRVKTLELFGSALDGRFDQESSDLDFLVEFLPVPVGEIAPDYFGLLHSLEDLFSRKIDLVMTRAIRNQYFLGNVDRSRQVIYAA